MAYDSKVVIKILGDATNFDKAINGAEASLNGLKSVLAKLGLGAMFAKATKEIVSNTTQLESSLATASTLFGAVNVNMDTYTKKVLELSKATGVASSAIVNASYQAMSSGVEATEDMGTLMDFMEQVTKLSVAGMTSVENAVDSVAKIWNAYGQDVITVEQISKNLVMTQNLGITTVDQLSQSLATVTPTASAFGVSLENIGASLSVMTKAGTDTARATTQLNSVISSLASADSEASKNLKKATKEVTGQEKSFSELIKEGKNLQEILLIMKEYAEGAGISLVDLFTEMNAGRGALQIASDSTGTFTEYLKQMESEVDIVQETYDKMMNTTAKDWSLLANRLKNITIKIGMSEGSQGILDDTYAIAEKIVKKLEEISPKIGAIISVVRMNVSALLSYIAQKLEEQQVIQCAIEFVGEQWERLKKAFETGDVKELVEMAKESLTILLGVSLARASLDGLMSGLLTALGSGATATATGISLPLTLVITFGWSDIIQGFIDGFKTGNDSNGIIGAIGEALNQATSGLLTDWLRGLGFEWLDIAYSDWIEDYAEQFGISAKKVSDWFNDNKQKLLEYKGSLEDFFEQTRKGTGFLGTNKTGLYLSDMVLEGMEKEGVTKFEELSEAEALVYLERFKEILGIHSPSKEFEQIGEYIMQGLEEGMSSERISELTSQLEIEFQNMGEKMVQALIDGYDDEGNKYDWANFISDMMKGNSNYLEWANALATAEPKPPKNNSDSDNDNNDNDNNDNDNDKDTETAKTSFWAKASNWLFGDIGDGDNKIGKTGMDVITSLTDSFSDLNSAISDGISASYDAQISALEKARDTAKENNQLSVEEEIEYNNQIAKLRKEQFEKQKKISIANAVMNGASAILSIWSEWAKAPLMASALTALAVATTAQQISTISSQTSGYERGGLIGGHGYTGDKQQIWANAGELILNRTQQRAIADQLSYGGNSTVIQVDFSGNVFGDQQTIAEYVYDAIKTAQAQGAIRAW